MTPETERFTLHRVDGDTVQIIDGKLGQEFAVCSDFEMDVTTAQTRAEIVAVALNFSCRWRALIDEKIKACERHQRERPDRAAALDNTHRVLTELLTEAGNEWEEANDPKSTNLSKRTPVT